MSQDKLRRLQKMLDVMKKRAFEAGLRHTDKYLYKAVHAPSGEFTHAYTWHESLDAWYQRVCANVSLSAKDDNWIKNQLSKCTDAACRLPRKNLHVFAFRNGIFSTTQHRFVPYAPQGDDNTC
jgi:hypothetical protein